jgi:hypothetical protein
VVDKARNELSAAVPKFCLALEEHRRTADGRVRTSQEMLSNFFPYDDKGCTDKVFRYLPNDVRGPIVAAWGIRGLKASLRDTDDKVQSVVHDALVAGDVDHTAFEEALTAETLVRWLPLGDLWSFWRGGKLTKGAIHKALATAYELYLFDGRWFLDAIHGRGGSLKGTDVLAEGLTKEDLSAWVRRIAETGDGSPKGIVAALGWDKIVAKTSNDILVSVLDAIVAKVGLVQKESKADAAKVDSSKGAAPPASAVIPVPAPAPSAPSVATSAASGEASPGDEQGWSKPPAPPEGGGASIATSPPPVGSEEQIAVVLEDDLMLAAGNGTDGEEEAEQTMVAERPLPTPSKPPGRWEKKR